jgi:hypothetical protein
MSDIANMTFEKHAMTTITISMKNRQELVRLGSKDMSFDQILSKVLERSLKMEK